MLFIGLIVMCAWLVLTSINIMQAKEYKRKRKK